MWNAESMLAPILAAVATVVGPSVTVQPAVTVLKQVATVRVVGVSAPTLEVHLRGASVAFGHPTPWTHLHRAGGGWGARLPVPELRGIYPVELRVREGSPVIRSTDWFLRVYAPGTLARPTFPTPEQVAGWWVRTVPPGAKLVALKRWPAPGFDLRDPRLHQLMVIAYTVPNAGRLGIFITAVRNRFNGPWRLLEATAAP
jgi:hypothetical protein